MTEITAPNTALDLEVGSKSEQPTFVLIRQLNGIAHIVINDVNEKVNTLKQESAEQLMALLNEIKEDDNIRGLVIKSGKADSFIAGADINMIANCQSAAEATHLSRQGQVVCHELEHFHIPVVAAIHGACLGGGLELAMACHARICSDSEHTVFALPEVKLGLLPGSGGTQRLPKLVSLQQALTMMLTGKQLRAKQALKSGLVFSVVPESIIATVADDLALYGVDYCLKKMARAQAKRDRGLFAKISHFLLEQTPLGQYVIFQQASKTARKQTKGNYPAPEKIIEAVRVGTRLSEAQGYQVEADGFGHLAMTEVSKQLRGIFFASTQLKKEQSTLAEQATPVNHVAVLGGGLMGGGIAYVTATKAKNSVRIKDISHQGIHHALSYSYKLLKAKEQRKFITPNDLQRSMAKISGTTDYNGFAHVDIVVEAVFEELALKQNMVAEIEDYCHENTIFASNTSSLPIADIAEHAKRPENVIGLHYFSPVDKMPLVEIIPHPKTSARTIASTVALAKAQGKTPIIVQDQAGFYVNRILAPYVNEAAQLLLIGEKIDKIDKALVKFGFPVGPLMLLDEVGIDIGVKISPILEQAFGKRFTLPEVFHTLIDQGRLGKKTGKGFYRYPQGGAKKQKAKQPDEHIYQLLNVSVQQENSAEEIAKRCVYMMLNEACRCLAEDIITCARDGDIGAIFGIGFPPFLGGPFRYIDSIGADHLVAQLNQLSVEAGERFTPCQLLVEMAESGEKFYPE